MSGSCAGWREHKELLVRGRRVEEGGEIDQVLRGSLHGARRMGDEPPGIIRKHERGGGFGFGTGLASFALAPHTRPKALFIIDDEHDVLPLPSELLLALRLSHMTRTSRKEPAYAAVHVLVARTMSRRPREFARIEEVCCS
jgi:hypothetical protein